jgi:hypothetical protein
MKKTVLSLALLGLLALGGQAIAVICTIDDVPAATLLLPYFEVDLSDGNGINTLFSINNASATAVLAHVVLWTDLSVPTFDFNVYLTGYDVQTISIRDIFNGTAPRTASAGQDPGDSISPHGEFSQDINFASCSGQLPPPPIPASFVTHLRAAHTGQFSAILNGCSGRDLGDNIARGYITVDTVNNCTLRFPGDAGYFVSGGSGDATNQNVLWGDYFYVNNAENFAQGETLVHIESCPTCFVAGDHTFYGRYNGALADDSREALPTTEGVRFINGGDFNGGTNLKIWREANAADSSYTCTNQGPPSWWPLESTQIVIFDEQEQPVTAEECPSGDPTCEQEVTIPNEANDIDVALDLLAPFDFGWLYLNLQHNNPGFVAIYGDPYAQSWTTAVMDATGRFSVGFDAIQLDNANTPNTTIIPVP